MENYFRRLSKGRVGREIADACWSILGGVAQFQLMRFACRYYREHIFTPQAISAAMDMAGGTCNYRAYEVVRMVEVDAQDPLKEKKRDVYIFPNERFIRMASKKLNLYANQILPMRHYYTVNGEVIEYEDLKKSLSPFCCFWTR